MSKQVWAFTVCCVMEGRTRERAWEAALEYLAEWAAKGNLEYNGAELIEGAADEQEEQVMRHTPGPWTIEYETKGGEPYDDGVRIDSPEGPVAFNVIDCSANLIAAAPALLDACVAVANDCERLIEGDDFSGMSDAELFGAFVRTLRSAISKAEGRGE